MKQCLGDYKGQGECNWCSLALFCIDITMAVDKHIDELADRQSAIEEMENDHDFREKVVRGR